MKEHRKLIGRNNRATSRCSNKPPSGSIKLQLGLFGVLWMIAFSTVYASDQLVVAVGNNNIDTTTKLLAHGAHVNRPSREGVPPLVEAAYSGYVEMVKLLLESGARVDSQNRHGATALVCAALKGNTEIAKLLIAHGADLNHVSKIGQTPLMFAAGAYGADLELVVKIVETGVDINSKTPNGITAFGLAALVGNSSIALWLYENGADPSIQRSSVKSRERWRIFWVIISWHKTTSKKPALRFNRPKLRIVLQSLL